MEKIWIVANKSEGRKMGTKIQIDNKTIVKIEEPKKVDVVMYNDDFTPMDFVVDILMSVFHKSEIEAVAIMMAIHKGTKEVVGNYVYDIARTKVDICLRKAREKGYPFLVKIEA